MPGLIEEIPDPGAPPVDNSVYYLGMTTTSPRYEVHTTGPRVHYCLDTKTSTLYGPHKSKRSAQAIVDEKNENVR